MILNDLTKPENMHTAPLGNKRKLASACHYVWMRFLWHLRPGTPPIDVMIWEVEGPLVRVRPASTGLNESSRGFKRSLPQYFELQGYKATQRTIAKQKGVDPDTIAAQLETFEADVIAQLHNAIVAGLKYGNATRSFQKFNPNGRPFTVLMTRKDDGLHASDFTLVWRNEKGLSLRQIANRTKKAHGQRLPKGARQPSEKELLHARLREERQQERKDARAYAKQQAENLEQQRESLRRKIVKQIAAAERKRPAEKKRPSSGRKLDFLLSLDDGPQFEKALTPKVELDKLVEIAANYRWSSFDEYDNRMYEYSYALINPAITMAKPKSIAQLWRKFNRPQKVFYALLNFCGETDNGGVWQFLFNEPELAVAALEAMVEVKATKLASDYRKVLDELVGKANSVAAIRKKFANSKLTDKKRWDAFASGYGQLKTAAVIQKYFYGNTFRKNLYRSMSKYVESHLHLMADVTYPSDFPLGK